MAVLGRSRSGPPPPDQILDPPLINLSNTQFRYQLVFFIHIYGWLKVAFGICCLGKTCRRHLLPGGMFCFLQCY